MENKFNLEEYLNNGVENIIKGIVKASLSNPRESIFISKYIISSQKLKSIRKKLKDEGEHIPPFLIASITSKCNLHCRGCYARVNNCCHDEIKSDEMNAKQWFDIFTQAKDIGIGFILLAGGEPLIRKDIINEAAKFPQILFPIFTNGTMIDEEYINKFMINPNLIPILSLEGKKIKTNKRRGEGVYENLIEKMSELKEHKILYGVSITVTNENLKEVTSYDFITQLYILGCKAIVYVEYVPIKKGDENLVICDEQRNYLRDEINRYRSIYEDMIIISFPGDEKSSGGCLAAGRGFFHINYSGGVEPCPFSPFSDTSLKEKTLIEALKSPLFKKLNNDKVLEGEHIGGCVLFEREEQVKKLLKYNE